MKRYSPGALAGQAVAQPNRPATAIVHDVDDARLVVFRIGVGQEVPPHRSPSTVLLSVLEGSGIFTGEDGQVEVAAGDLLAYEPNELHGMKAVDEQFVVLATIAPRPATRQPVSR
jgi:quercetin dioxygenase-like cupin family protein